MFELEWKDEDWTLIYTQKHSTKDISYMDEEMLSTVKRVNEALLKDDLFSIIEPNMADTAVLLNILGEIEMCTGWNMFERRETEEIVKSLIWMLCSHGVYDSSGARMN